MSDANPRSDCCAQAQPQHAAMVRPLQVLRVIRKERRRALNARKKKADGSEFRF
jgi:hypothetical protein